ncbi:hypothetical protein LCGC14_1799460 [marine sediment metagenome]|uniref:Uncharacterized protein n=1 Tax=marine sediment metagenome TaxID=412755 RepID=A0A0F9HCT3_9ZZZZ
MDASINAYLKVGRRILARVWFSGTTALKEGQGLAYNFDYFPSGGAVTNSNPDRYNRVELPATANSLHFAGVSAHAYAASSTGQFIEICLPGSVCNIWLNADVVIGVGIITCEAGNALGASSAGYFTRAGFQGEGSAVPLQTVTGASTAALCLAYLQIGLPSGLVEVVQPPSTGALMTLLPSGLTCFTAQTIGTGDATATLANSTIIGQYKAYQCEGTMTTNSVLVTITSGLQKDDSTAFATGTFDADAEDVYFKWNGEQWEEESSAGLTIG